MIEIAVKSDQQITEDYTAKELYASIKEEVLECYDDIKSFSSFDEFFAELDVDNAYEGEREENKEVYKPSYKAVFDELISN